MNTLNKISDWSLFTPLLFYEE